MAKECEGRVGWGGLQVFYPSSNRNYRMTCSSVVIPISSDEQCGKRLERSSGFRIQRSQNWNDESSQTPLEKSARCCTAATFHAWFIEYSVFSNGSMWSKAKRLRWRGELEDKRTPLNVEQRRLRDGGIKATIRCRVLLIIQSIKVNLAR